MIGSPNKSAFLSFNLIEIVITCTPNPALQIAKQNANSTKMDEKINVKYSIIYPSYFLLE